ncbi:MAG: hypothetical protein K5640_05760 [Treponema sp.]|nr:hypothetical protein [Treponema sp.]
MKFLIETNKTKDEILQIIRNNTSEHRGVFFSNNGEFFNGKILENSFKIQRNISYRNSFLPVIIGNIEEKDSGAKVSIKMRMNLFIKGFMTFWFSFVILFCLMVPFLHFDMPFCFIPYIMLVFGIVIVVLPNRIETRKAKEKLEDLLR